MVREDLSALIPGSGRPLNRESLLRLLLYLALITLLLRLAWPLLGDSAPGQTREPHPEASPPGRLIQLDAAPTSPLHRRRMQLLVLERA
ncbi:MAG: hypothetical protein K1X75_02495 [Leptospirales bacterium]|nr:hypothetical protein [Leptospirales bacterium]